MGTKKIAIVGSKGMFGSWLTRFFQQRGCEVRGTDTFSAYSLFDVLVWAEVVIFCVPLKEMVSVIRQAVMNSNSDQLWLDIASTKHDVVREMLKSDAEVVGMHPLFAPSDKSTWEGERLEVCYARLDEWRGWFEMFLKETRAMVIETDPVAHDDCMLYVQNLFQICKLAEAAVICASETAKPLDLLRHRTRSSERQCAVLARMLKQKPDTFVGIQMARKDESVIMIDRLVSALVNLRTIIEAGNDQALFAEFRRLRDCLGEEFISEAEGFF